MLTHEVRDRSHWATTQNFYVIRNGLHGYQCYCSRTTTEKGTISCTKASLSTSVDRPLHWRMAEILFQESLQHFNLSLFGNDKSNVRATTKTKQENGKKQRKQGHGSISCNHC